ncbi:Serrate RNA effector molecule [Chamberlinius hualienensis]
MADSDDEYERRRARDKFRRERSDYQERVDRGGGRGDDRGRRDEYADGRRELWTRERVRRDYGREVDLRRRERFSPPRHDMSPPMKKMRRDWDDRGYGGYDSGYSGNAMAGHQGNWGSMGHEISGGMHLQHSGGGGGYGGPVGGGVHGSHRDIDMCPTLPPMMSFKQFLASQDDSISDDEAVRKYSDYKLEFRRQQLNEFFLAHKDEEWKLAF